MDLSLVIPCYNEGFRINNTIDTVTDYLRASGKSYEIIIVDDGSGDDTLAKARTAAEGRSDIRIIDYKPNKGKGNAVREGVLAAEGDLIAFTDADLSAPIEELDKLLAAIDDGAAVAIGSRAVAHSEIVVHQPLYREIGGKCLNLIIQVFAVPGIHDTQCGFKIFRGAPAKRIFKSSFIDGWGFDIEVLYLARRMGLRIDEIPVRWSHGEGSKISPFRAGLQVLKDIARMRLHVYDANTKGGI